MYDLMSACSTLKNKKPIILLTARDVERNWYAFKKTDFTPFFYGKTTNPENAIFDIFDRLVTKVETPTPGDVKQARRNYEFTDQADIRYELNMLIQYGIYCGFRISNQTITPSEHRNVSPRIGRFDVEVLSPLEIYPRPKQPHYPMTSFTISDSYTDELHAFIYLKPTLPVKWDTYDPFSADGILDFDWEPFDNKCFLHLCESEREVFVQSAKYVRNTKFDVLTGWYTLGYDWPYIFERAPRVRFDTRNYSPFHITRFSQNPQNPRKFTTQIGGMSLTDLLVQYRTLTLPEGQKTTFDLKFIVTEETKDKPSNPRYCLFCERTCKSAAICEGFRYEDFGDRLSILYEKHQWNEFIKYCFRDIVALDIVDNSRNVTAYFDQVRRKFGCFLEDAHVRAKVCDAFLLRLSNKPLPTKTEGKTRADREKVQGAYVKEPIKGIHENVGVIDVRGMYPAFIEALNISPEMKSSKGELICANGIRFKKSPIGLYPRAVKRLDAEVKALDKQMLDAIPGSNEWEYLSTQRETTKYTRNAVFGYTAYVGARMPDTDCTNAITAEGRATVLFMIDTVESKGYVCPTGDTDSVHVKVSSWQELVELEKLVSQALLDYSTKRSFTRPLEISLDKFYSAIYYSRKKGYAGFCVLNKGRPYNKMIIMGLAAKRSDSAILTRIIQPKFFEMILKDKDIRQAISIIKETVNKIKNFEQSDLQLSQIGLPKGLQMSLESYQHFLWAEAVKWSMEHLKMRFKEDQKPRLIYGWVRGLPKPQLLKKKTVAFAIRGDEDDYLKEKVVLDKAKMIETVIYTKFIDSLEAIGKTWDDILYEHPKKQSQLGVWAK